MEDRYNSIVKCGSPREEGVGNEADVSIAEENCEESEAWDETRSSDAAKDLIEAHRNQLLRLQADFDNFRKRTRRDQDQKNKEAENKLLLSLLPVIDHFEMGLEATKKDGYKDANVEGFRLVHNQLVSLLKDYDVHALKVVGEPFDPHWHEGVAMEPSNEFPEQRVVKEIRRGYSRAGALLRAARVLVSSGASRSG